MLSARELCGILRLPGSVFTRPPGPCPVSVLIELAVAGQRARVIELAVACGLCVLVLVAVS